MPDAANDPFRKPDDFYKPRFHLTYTEYANAKAAYFPLLVDARAFVHQLGLPVTILDTYVRQRGTLFPSGALRWSNRS